MNPSLAYQTLRQILQMLTRLARDGGALRRIEDSDPIADEAEMFLFRSLAHR
jgi:hypothetical protein